MNNKIITDNPLSWFQGAADLLQSFLRLYHLAMSPLEKNLKLSDKLKRPIISYQSFGALTTMGINLLAGLSIEILFKTCIHVIDKNELKKIIENNKGHCLVLLYNKINDSWNLNFDKNYITLLQELEEYVLWKGKYPESKKGNSFHATTHRSVSDKKFDKIKFIWEKTTSELFKKHQVLLLYYKTSIAQNNYYKSTETSYFENEEQNAMKAIKQF